MTDLNKAVKAGHDALVKDGVLDPDFQWDPEILPLVIPTLAVLVLMTAQTVLLSLPKEDK